MGRWGWLLFEGKRQVKTRIFSVYVPIVSKRDASVYQQQKRYFLEKNKDLCPKKELIRGLVREIKRCQNNHERVIVCADANENLLRHGPFVQAMRVQCGLQEILPTLHPDIQPPRTNQMGVHPIDGIFVSPALNNATRGGWLKFGEGIGDHRPLFVDIPIKKLLGESRFRIQRPYVRRLKCNDPRIVSNFNNLFESNGNSKKIFDNYKKLKGSFGVPMTQSVRSALFSLDSDVTSTTKYAEKKCRKLRMGQIEFTAESAKLRVDIELWNVVIRKKNGANVSSTYIKRLAKHCNIVNPMNLSIEDCKLQRSEKYQELFEFAKDSKKSRIDFINSLADAIAKDGNEKRSTVVRRLNYLEEERLARSHIRRTVKTFGGATSKIRVDDIHTGDSYFVTEKGVIEEALKNENQSKYLLAYSSPFLQEPLLSLLGQNSLTQAGDAILQGTFIPPDGLSEHTKHFISLLQMDDRLQREGCNSHEITTAQSLQYWSKKPEKTSSSMSGRHIGTYKAARKAPQAFEILNGIMNMAYKGGVSLPRWQNTLDVSLLKKPGKFRPSELRTIGQLEADFNQGAAVHFSKRMMDRALKLNLIPSAQYAKKGSNCVDAALVKILFFEHLRFRRLSGAYMTKDLMQCFDRMAHPVSALCTRRLGVPPMIVKSMISSLTRMRHFLRTAYGDSTISYGGNLQQPLQGAIQGNGAAAQIFVALSCVMIAFLESQITGFSITTSLSLTILSFVVVMYVDDADILLSAGTHDELLDNLVQRTQHAANIWRIGAEQTGAALRPEKCKWYLISFRWKNGKPNFNSNAQTPAQIFQRDTNGVQHLVTRCEVSESIKGLGIYFNPLGCWKHQYEDLFGKVETWCNIIRTSSLSPHEVYVGATTGIARTIHYGLPLTSFSKKQCNSIDTAFYGTILPRMKMNRHLPKAYRYAPKRYHGLGLPQTIITQYIAKVKRLIFHMNQNTELGISMVSLMETFHLSMGVHTPIFELEYDKFHFLLESCWMKDIWCISSKYKIQICGSYTTPQLQRAGDFSIMEKLVRSNKFTQNELLQINRIRVFLQVLFMSDVTNVSGTHLRQEMVKMQRNSRKSRWEWPYQYLDSRKGLKLWKKALLEICTETKTLQLQDPLGSWCIRPHLQSSWFISSCKKRVFHQVEENSFLEYVPISSLPIYRDYFQAEFHQQRIPADCCDVEVVSLQRGQIRVEGVIDVSAPSQHQFCIHNNQFLTSDPVLHSLLRFSTIDGDGHSIARALTQHTAVAVTDASVASPVLGAASWVIQCKDCPARCEGRVRVPTGSSDMNSYRAEIFGIYSILVAVQQICSFHNVRNGSLIVACDNDSGLLHSLIFERRVPLRFKSFDIIWAIHGILPQLPITIIPEQVTGHTDRLAREKTFNEILNIEMDEKAKDFCSYNKENDVSAPQFFRDSNWFLLINNQRVTENVDGNIQDHIHAQALFRHLVGKNYVSAEAISLISWKALDKAHKSLERARFIWAVKYASRFLPTGNHCFRQGTWDSALCPLCKTETETNTHIMQCQCPVATMERHTKLYDLYQWMIDNHGDPHIAQTIIYTLINGSQTKFVDMIPTAASSAIRIAAQDQDCIGWDNLLVGRIASSWVVAQQQYHECTSSNPNEFHGITWMGRFISKLYEAVHAVWMYRNGIVHECVEEKLNQQELRKLHAEIDRLYALGPSAVRHNHRCFFTEGIESTKNKSVRQKKYWIRTLQVSADYQKNCSENMYVGMRAIMQQWALYPD